MFYLIISIAQSDNSHSTCFFAIWNVSLVRFMKSHQTLSQTKQTARMTETAETIRTQPFERQWKQTCFSLVLRKCVLRCVNGTWKREIWNRATEAEISRETLCMADEPVKISVRNLNLMMVLIIYRWFYLLIDLIFN